MWISGGALRCSSRCGNGISMLRTEFVPDPQEHVTLDVGDAILWIVDPDAKLEIDTVVAKAFE
jgi:hypothetical protein